MFDWVLNTPLRAFYNGCNFGTMNNDKENLIGDKVRPF